MNPQVNAAQISEEIPDTNSERISRETWKGISIEHYEGMPKGFLDKSLEEIPEKMKKCNP